MGEFEFQLPNKKEITDGGFIHVFDRKYYQSFSSHL